ncbi:hypothetical protein GCM10011614_19410 [Novosphingobium colocasiae]|uniref:Uncharacterized protein n=1 Tax=Novosphingobium colocasiae TaxID=1256513 RepID=A0A918PFU5_9SPHN|nr:hypothetical protein GCM10011614_19410 [Novosphingobium colocasiae]
MIRWAVLRGMRRSTLIADRLYVTGIMAARYVASRYIVVKHYIWAVDALQNASEPVYRARHAIHRVPKDLPGQELRLPDERL